MSFKRWNGSAYVSPTTMKRWDGSTWQPVQSVKRWDGSAWVSAWTSTPPSVTISAGTTSPSCTYSTAGSGCTASTTITANASGGSGSFTYQWTLLSGTAAIASPTSASTLVSQGGTTSSTAVFQVVITDTATGKTASAQVSISFSHNPAIATG